MIATLRDGRGDNSKLELNSLVPGILSQAESDAVFDTNITDTMSGGKGYGAGEGDENRGPTLEVGDLDIEAELQRELEQVE